MEVFAVVLNEEDKDACSRIEKMYPQNYRLSDSCVLIASKSSTSIVTAASISEHIKMTSEDAPDDFLGLVLELNSSYAGRNYKDLWQWISEVKSIV